MGDFGDLLGVWPSWQQRDPNYYLATPYVAGGIWVRGSEYDLVNGCLPLSLAGRMRVAGLRPVLIASWLAGNPASAFVPYCTNTFGPYCAQRIAQLPSVRSVTLVWSQGEYEAALGDGALWLSNTRLSIAAMRSALGESNLHVVIIQLPKTWNPQAGNLANYLAEVRAAQETLVSTDAYASIVCALNVRTVNAGVHLGQFDLDRQARLVVSDIVARVL
jgi:hypothetical protein